MSRHRRNRALTFDQHQDLGTILFAYRNHLLRIEGALANRLGKMHQARRAAEDALRAIDHLRDAMEAEAVAELGSDISVLNLYRPGDAGETRPLNNPTNWPKEAPGQ